MFHKFVTKQGIDYRIADLIIRILRSDQTIKIYTKSNNQSTKKIISISRLHVFKADSKQLLIRKY